MNEGIERIQHRAHSLLELDPDPAPRLRILRDLLYREFPGPELDCIAQTVCYT